MFHSNTLYFKQYENTHWNSKELKKIKYTTNKKRIRQKFYNACCASSKTPTPTLLFFRYNDSAAKECVAEHAEKQPPEQIHSQITEPFLYM